MFFLFLGAAIFLWVQWLNILMRKVLGNGYMEIWKLQAMGQSLLQGYSWSKLYSFFWEEMTHVFDYNETNINTLLLFKLGTDFLTSSFWFLWSP